MNADSRALDVPAGVPYAPRAVPLQLLIVELRLCKPEHKVALIALIRILFNTLADALLEILAVVLVKHVVLLEL